MNRAPKGRKAAVAWYRRDWRKMSHKDSQGYRLRNQPTMAEFEDQELVLSEPVPTPTPTPAPTTVSLMGMKAKTWIPLPMPKDAVGRIKARLEEASSEESDLVQDILEEFSSAQAWARCQSGPSRFRTYSEEPDEEQVESLYLTCPQSPSRGLARLGAPDEEA